MSVRSLVVPLLLGVVAWTSVPDRSPDRPTAPARGLGASVATIDLGTLPAGASARRRLTLRNDGACPVRIVDVRKSCGCASFRVEATTIAPGAVVDAEVSVTARAGAGVTGERVVVVDDGGGEVPITLRYRSLATSWIEPRELDYGRVAEEDLPAVVEARTTSPAPRGPGADGHPVPESDVPWLAVAHLETRADGTDRFQVVLMPDCPWGEWRADVTVRAPGSSLAQVVPVRGCVVGEVCAVPRAVVLGPSTAAADRPAEVELRRRSEGEEAWRVAGVRVSPTLQGIVRHGLRGDVLPTRLGLELEPQREVDVRAARIDGSVEVALLAGERSATLQIPVVVLLAPPPATAPR